MGSYYLSIIRIKKNSERKILKNQDITTLSEAIYQEEQSECFKFGLHLFWNIFAGVFLTCEILVEILLASFHGASVFINITNKSRASTQFICIAKISN